MKLEPVFMAIGSHPDDIEIGIGGTVSALTSSGAKVIFVDLTDGEPTPHGTHEKRIKESLAAAKVLGVERRITLDMPNREVYDTVENRKKLGAVIREFKPTVLFVPYWEDAHPDHVQAAQLSQAAGFYSKFVKSDMPFTPHKPNKIFHYFCLHLRAKFQPSFVFDISTHINKKMDSIAAYRSQFFENKQNVGVIQHIRNESAYWGHQIGANYGEPLICRENIRMASAESLLNA